MRYPQIGGGGSPNVWRKAISDIGQNSAAGTHIGPSQETNSQEKWLTRPHTSPQITLLLGMFLFLKLDTA